MTLLDALRQNIYFNALSAANMDTLANAMTVATYADGDVFIREGATGNTAYLVVEGAVSVTRTVGGEAHEVERLEAGTFVGLMALIDDEPRAASCVAIGRTVIATLSRDNYAELSSSSTSISLAFQQAIGTQLARDFRNIAAKVHELLNDQSKADHPFREYDVAVIGGGPLGLVYATWVRRFRPGTRVVVIERRDKPGHKVGESTLSTTVRCFNAMGLNHSVLRRLFGNKAGLRWFHTEEDGDTLNLPFDIVDIEETYQVERRVLETAMQYMATTREGVELLTDTQVMIRESDLESDINTLVCKDANGDKFNLRCKVVCDASGPASVIPRHLGVYRKDPAMLNTFNYNSYFAYFRPKKELPIDFWSYPATRHICFKEGWLWFISLISWEQNPTENLEALIHHLLDLEAESDADYPTREELSEQFGLTNEPVFSIGFTIRDDLDVTGLSIEERFNYWVEKYPAISWVMEHFELVEAPYTGKQRATFAFMNMLHDTEQVAGDGWVAIGDAAVFVNPYFSLGLNYGTGTAYMAAKDTVAGLERGDVSKQAFEPYAEYASAIFKQNANITDMYYRAFKDPLSFERTLLLTIAWGIADVLPRGEYADSDPFVFNLLDPEWVAVTSRIADLQREGERLGRHPHEVAKDVEQIVNPFIERVHERFGIFDMSIGKYMRFYDDDWMRADAPRFDKEHGDYEAIKCGECSLFFDDSLERCPYCGESHPENMPA
jgi:flavin-dependent dehydrogenase/CRP-like cAMP-binding protein